MNCASDSRPFRITRANVIAVAEALVALRYSKERVKKMAMRYPVFISVSGYSFVLDRKMSYEEFEKRLEDYLLEY